MAFSSGFVCSRGVKRTRRMCVANYARYNVSEAKRRANRNFRRTFKVAINSGAIEAYSEFNPSRYAFLTGWEIT